jgi:hypothetical protein
MHLILNLKFDIQLKVFDCKSFVKNLCTREILYVSIFLAYFMKRIIPLTM